MFHMTNDDRWNALILSAFTTLSVGFTYEVMAKVESSAPNARLNTSNIKTNTVGVAASTLIIMSFDF